MKAIMCAAATLAVIASVSASSSYAQDAAKDVATTAASAQDFTFDSPDEVTGERLGKATLSLVTTVLPVHAPGAALVGGAGSGTALEGPFQGTNTLNAGVANGTGGQAGGTMMSGAGGIGMITGTQFTGGSMPEGVGGSISGGGLVGNFVPGN